MQKLLPDRIPGGFLLRISDFEFRTLTLILSFIVASRKIVARLSKISAVLNRRYRRLRGAKRDPVLQVVPSWLPRICSEPRRGWNRVRSVPPFQRLQQ